MVSLCAALLKALGGVSKLEKVLGIWHAGKLFYALSTWGLALAGCVSLFLLVLFLCLLYLSVSFHTSRSKRMAWMLFLLERPSMLIYLFVHHWPLILVTMRTPFLGYQSPRFACRIRSVLKINGACFSISWLKGINGSPHPHNILLSIRGIVINWNNYTFYTSSEYVNFLSSCRIIWKF